jgi:hypothetical protein
MTISLASASALIVLPEHPQGITWLTAGVVVGFWALEYRWRLDWLKYVQRYELIRDVLHDGRPIQVLSPLDLTDHYRRNAREQLYEKAYGPNLGPMLEKALRGENRSMPLHTTQEMSYFYTIAAGALVLLPTFLHLV